MTPQTPLPRISLAGKLHNSENTKTSTATHLYLETATKSIDGGREGERVLNQICRDENSRFISEKKIKTYLNFGDKVPILCRCGHGGHEFSSVHLKLRSVVVRVRDVHSHDRLALASCCAALALDVERVEEERHLLRRLVGGRLVGKFVFQKCKKNS